MRWAALGSNLFLYYHLIIFYCMAAWYYMSFICRSHGPRCHRIPLDDPLPLGRFTWIRGRHLSWVFCSPNPSSHLTKWSMPRHSGPSEKIGKALSYEMYLGHCWYNWWKDAVHHWWKRNTLFITDRKRRCSSLMDLDFMSEVTTANIHSVLASKWPLILGP